MNAKIKLNENKQNITFTFKPLTINRWPDFEKLFGENGACGGCWCMAWRLTSSEFAKHKYTGTKRMMKSLVKKGEHIGIIAYYKKEPVGWCSFAPREEFKRLEKSKVLAPIDNEPVWSVTCFYIHKNYRKMGLSAELLKAVIKFAKKRKVKILEGYPSVPYAENIPAAFAWTGIPSSFEKAGFVEAERRSKARPIMRYVIEKESKKTFNASKYAGKVKLTENPINIQKKLRNEWEVN